MPWTEPDPTLSVSGREDGLRLVRERPGWIGWWPLGAHNRGSRACVNRNVEVAVSNQTRLFILVFFAFLPTVALYVYANRSLTAAELRHGQAALPTALPVRTHMGLRPYV